MNMKPRLLPLAFRLLTSVAALSLLSQALPSRAADSAFTKPIIDMGIVVKDAGRTAAFLTNVIGFKEVRGFPVSGDLGKKIGLIDNHATQVRVFALEEVEAGTRIKILSFPEAPGKQPDQTYIHSTLGMRYLTIYVKDINPVFERAKKAGVAALGETPVEVGTGTWLLAVKDPDGNFIELIGPRR